eukprot:scaffold23685_cov70-Skeletonema_marinoi.AAC.1
MVVLTDAEKVELLDPTKVTHLVCLLALSMAWRWVVRLECLMEMHWVQLMETHWLGALVGWLDGQSEGSDEGSALGAPVGWLEGIAEGSEDTLGEADGWLDGLIE